MSNVVDEKKKAETKKYTMDRYTIALEYTNPTNDEKILETLALEGARGDLAESMEGLLGWFLVYRSKMFPTLTRDKVSELADKVIYEEIGVAELSPAVACHKATFPLPNDSGEDEKEMSLRITFSPFKFGMLLPFR